MKYRNWIVAILTIFLAVCFTTGYSYAQLANDIGTPWAYHLVDDMLPIYPPVNWQGWPGSYGTAPGTWFDPGFSDFFTAGSVGYLQGSTFYSTYPLAVARRFYHSAAVLGEFTPGFTGPQQQTILLAPIIVRSYGPSASYTRSVWEVSRIDWSKYLVNLQN